MSTCRNTIIIIVIIINIVITIITIDCITMKLGYVIISHTCLHYLGCPYASTPSRASLGNA